MHAHAVLVASLARQNVQSREKETPNREKSNKTKKNSRSNSSKREKRRWRRWRQTGKQNREEFEFNQKMKINAGIMMNSLHFFFARHNQSKTPNRSNYVIETRSTGVFVIYVCCVRVLCLHVHACICMMCSAVVHTLETHIKCVFYTPKK